MSRHRAVDDHGLKRAGCLPAEEPPCPRRLCTQAGAALVLDEVRTGMRLHLSGSWEPLGIRPDLCAWSKAIANGYALAAVTGTDALRDAAGRIFTTGSFWAGSVVMAAGLATLAVARRDGLVATSPRPCVPPRPGCTRCAGNSARLDAARAGRPTVPAAGGPDTLLGLLRAVGAGPA